MREEPRAAEIRSAAPGSVAAFWRPLVAIGAIVAVIVLARVLDLGPLLAALRGWIEELGPWGPLAFVGLYVVGVVLALPGSAITVAAGLIFGTWMGTLLASVGSTVGASLAFLISRYVARDSVSRWASRSPKFRKLDRLTEEHGALIVALSRLVPIFPFNLLNYGFGLTRVRFSTYVFWSWLCMLPATLVFVAGGDAAGGAISEKGPSVPVIVALVLALVAMVLLARVAGARLRRAETEEHRP